MSFLLGLTGSIGMGKSTTAQMFASEGVPVWDADSAVHRLYAAGGQAVPMVAANWPDVIHDGAVSRERLKALLAHDPTVLSRLEAIVHPLLRQDRETFIASHDDPVLLFDIPLLFETGADTWLDAVLVVTAPENIQRDRVLARPGMTLAQFHMLLARQMPDAEKRARADFVIETVDMDEARAAVRALLVKLGGYDA